MDCRAGFLILIFLGTWPAVMAGPDCPATITLASQAQVDAFAINYSCTQVTGELIISGADITNLNGLAALTSVGTLTINSNPRLTDLSGLSGLTQIGSSCDCATPGLLLDGNPQLSSLNGLSALASIDGNLMILNNPKLATLAGLKNVSHVGAMLDVSNNASLSDIGALSRIDALGYWHLSSQSLRISGNSSLTEINILNNVTTLPGEIRIENNVNLQSMKGLSALTIIDGRRANIFITGNTSLEIISGFSALQTIRGGGNGGVITISNSALRDLKGLSSLKEIGGGRVGGLVISQNNLLEQIDDLVTLASITGGDFYLKIIDNPKLDRGCGLYPILHNNGVGGSWCDSSTCPGITISGNGPNCTKESILVGGECKPVVNCPIARNVIAEKTSGCGSVNTRIVIDSPEADVYYTLRDNSNNAIIAGPIQAASALVTGQLAKTTVFNVLARKAAGECEVVMNNLPTVTVNPLPSDRNVKALITSGCAPVDTRISIEHPEYDLQYFLRDNSSNTVVAGPTLGAIAGQVGFPTGALMQSVVYNVLSRNSITGCETVLSQTPVITVNPMPVEKEIVADRDSIVAGSSCNLMIKAGDPGVRYTLRLNDNNSVVDDTSPGATTFSTGPLFKTTSFYIFASTSANCTKQVGGAVVKVFQVAIVTGDLGDGRQLLLYPNPSNGEFEIQFPGDMKGPYYFSVRDVNGMVVNQNTFSPDQGTAHIDLKPLPRGTYVISFSGQSGGAFQQKLVITE